MRHNENLATWLYSNIYLINVIMRKVRYQHKQKTVKIIETTKHFETMTFLNSRFPILIHFYFTIHNSDFRIVYNRPWVKIL